MSLCVAAVVVGVVAVWLGSADGVGRRDVRGVVDSPERREPRGLHPRPGGLLRVGRGQWSRPAIRRRSPGRAALPRLSRFAAVRPPHDRAQGVGGAALLRLGAATWARRARPHPRFVDASRRGSAPTHPPRRRDHDPARRTVAPRTGRRRGHAGSGRRGARVALRQRPSGERGVLARRRRPRSRPRAGHRVGQRWQTAHRPVARRWLGGSRATEPRWSRATPTRPARCSATAEVSGLPLETSDAFSIAAV